MVILITLVIYSALWAAIWLLGPAAHARASSTAAEPARGSSAVCALLVRARQPRRTPSPSAGNASPDGGVSPTGTQAGLAWTALDDLQLTRLLSDAARSPNAE